MLIFENIAVAVNGLLSNKMRALLTMLGIIIGIGSVIGIMTVGDSLTTGMSEEFQSMGAGNIEIYVQQRPDETEEGGDMMAMGMGMMYSDSTVWYTPDANQDYINPEMIDRMKAEFGTRIKYVTANEQINASTAKNGKNSGRINTTGANVDSIKAANLNMRTGRLINENDEENGKKVCVISDSLAKDLYGNEDPINKTLDIDINGTTYTFHVVGVYEYKAGSGMFSYMGASTTVYIPLSTAKRINNSSANFSNITVVAGVGENSDALSTEINNFFEKEYKYNRRFTAMGSSMQSMVESATKSFKTISIAISVIAGISLLVGGIGVMNIMLVSITERTREIGTRKALGATNGSIRFQFIVESVIICLVGGTIGIILGVGLGSIGSKLVGYAARPSVTSMAIAVGFSMAIGVFFGYYPANKAAKLDPIEALRYE